MVGAGVSDIPGVWEAAAGVGVADSIGAIGAEAERNTNQYKTNTATMLKKLIIIARDDIDNERKPRTKTRHSYI